jgi:RNA polymerase sigma factor (sigma-70 family)
LVRSKLTRCGIHSVDVDNLLQAVFQVAHRRRATLPAGISEAGIRWWLSDIARKLAANWRRRWQHDVEVLDPEAIEAALAEPEDAEAHAALCMSVRKAFHRLPLEDQVIFWQHAVEGASMAEIAAQLGSSKSAVHLRIENARERLKAYLRDSYVRFRYR